MQRNGEIMVTPVGDKLNSECLRLKKSMSEQQLTALFTKLKDDAGLREKLQGAADLDASLAIAKEAGFDVSKQEWLSYQASQTSELSDAELEGMAGGITGIKSCNWYTGLGQCVCA